MDRQLSHRAAPILSRALLSQLTKERHDHLSQALGLFERKAVTGVLDLFDSHAWVDVPRRSTPASLTR